MRGWSPRVFAVSRAADRLPAELPPKRARVLDLVRSELARGKPFPSTRRIADALGWKYASSAHQALMTLAGDGYLTRTFDRSSGRTLTRFDLTESGP